MKHILRIVSIAVSLVCAPEFAMAFLPGVPPHSGPGSVFEGNDKAAPTQSQPKKQKSKKSRSGMHHSSPQ